MFKKKDRWVKTDKDGFKSYGMKMDTGYLNTQGHDLKTKLEQIHREAKEKHGEKLQFNYVQKLIYPMKRIKIRVPGMTGFGLKLISITDYEANVNLFGGYGFTIFGMTRCRVPKKVTEKMEIGKKYKITIQNS